MFKNCAKFKSAMMEWVAGQQIHNKDHPIFSDQSWNSGTTLKRSPSPALLISTHLLEGSSRTTHASHQTLTDHAEPASCRRTTLTLAAVWSRAHCLGLLLFLTVYHKPRRKPRCCWRQLCLMELDHKDCTWKIWTKLLVINWSFFFFYF